MALGETQQILEMIKRSSRPLICVPANAGADGYASALGMARVLRKLEKRPEIVAADGAVPKQLSFLSGQDDVKTELEHLQQFVIELDATKTKVDELSYEHKDGKLYVYLSPKNGFWRPEDVQTSASGYRYDLIICIGSPDLESCAQLYADHPDFFYRTPIINLDHSPANEHFGHINAVDVTACATGEVCHDLIEAIEPGLIDEDIATAFLTGMIAKTKSFKEQTVTPKTLQTASKLIARGANRDAIVQNLYRTRSVSTLRLWGRALARLKADEDAKIVWTLLSRQDFMHAGAQENDLPDVIDELIASSPHAQVVALIYESGEDVRSIVRAERPLDATLLTAPFNPSGTREETRLLFPKREIVSAEKELVTHLKRATKQRAA
jgi:nanoRNase/pAp phosphatase (c-di-AMP/oligoRNAs hydrolase)